MDAGQPVTAAAAELLDGNGLARELLEFLAVHCVAVQQFIVSRTWGLIWIIVNHSVCCLRMSGNGGASSVRRTGAFRFRACSCSGPTVGPEPRVQGSGFRVVQGLGFAV